MANKRIRKKAEAPGWSAAGLPLSVPRFSPLRELGAETEALQRRVRPLGWDVEAFAPDMAVPHLELLRRDGEMKIRLQRAGLGWSIEVGWRKEVVRRGYRKGPEYSAIEWDEELLRFGGSSQICELSDALTVLAQLVAENPPPGLTGPTHGVLP